MNYKDNTSTVRNKLRVLQLRSSPFLGSPEKLILGRCAAMGSNRLVYCVGVFDEQPNGVNDFIYELEALDVKVLKLDASILRLHQTVKFLKKVVNDENITFFCSNDYKSNFFAFVLGKISKLPAIAVFHGRTSTDIKVRFYEKIDAFILKSFDVIVAVCDDAKKRLISKGISSEKIRVIPNAVDTSSGTEKINTSQPIYSEFSISPNDKLIVFAGRLSKEKGLTLLIQAATKVIRHLGCVKFILVGDGPERKYLEHLIKKYDLEGYVLLPGFRRDVHQFFSAMRFLVLPSLTEGMPVVILEAFAAGKAVIASRVGGIPEIVSHGINGLLVEPGNVEQLADAMTQMVNDDEMIRQMGINGLKMVREHYCFPVQVNNYNRLYQFVLENSRRRRK